MPEDQLPQKLNDFWSEKYKRESQKSWDKFYKRNETRFFKDRHWLNREFDSYFGIPENEPRTILEVGCGVGNLVYPLLECQPNLKVYCCDFSSRAVEFVQKNENYDAEHVFPFVCDIVETPLVNFVPNASVDTVTAIFVLSAIPYERQLQAFKNISSVLKPGGHLVFRDYCEGDYAKEKFLNSKEPSMIDEHTFVRQDGTISYFFDEKRVDELASDVGLENISLERVQRSVDNRKRELSMQRVFLQGVWRKKY
ncbi:actin binding methyltransferase [Schizosaccharomyces japonicus yFS275]|uniref:tRNA N(3)-methylcytidine methyltransferase n=1 Tax=Schizosaccharomyces japonicus (strain yFS275 / FY16936) TaxID=402676 RepID=B6K6V3_SCHJY|nr:actin binding methyltransferase [Schizosaccharomyces japonicus yFS275]EEB09257.1 actin binding methyltransferase [Schizosaccharomyces japonicus yFS275]